MSRDGQPADGRIVLDGLTKHFGRVHAVEGLSFTVPPGTITGFLGPNGAGKTTTLRMLLGLVTPTAGQATIGGVRYVDLARPATVVGAALEATGFHPGRTARAHLHVLCTLAGLPAHRAEEVLAQVGLADVGGRRVGGFSLGMRQRLQLAAALLGDPQVLVLDEPANGLDPEGMAWLRGFLRFFADQGRTVLVSSHVLAEVAQTVDQVVIIARGRLVRQASLAELTQGAGTLRVRSPQAERLLTALAGDGVRADGVRVERVDGDTLQLTGVEPAAVGRAALRAQVELHELTVVPSDLEQVFLALTADEGGIR
ncbi:MAG: ABC transporter ATP-binding protein [Actinomycetota bacterium]